MTESQQALVKQMQIVHGGQHVGAVGALLAPRLDQATCFEAIQHPVQQQVLCPTSNQTGAELRQHAEMETRMGQIEAERMLPLNTGAYDVGPLPIAQAL